MLRAVPASLCIHSAEAVQIEQALCIAETTLLWLNSLASRKLPRLTMQLLTA